MPDEDGYPTDEELERVRTWDVQDPAGCFDFIKSLWWAPDWGWQEESESGRRRYHLSTGGWSGNESLIDAMQGNFLWTLTWQSSRRGGHYVFEFEEAA